MCLYVCAEVEIAVGAPRARKADKDNSKSTMMLSSAEKKSSFATDKWLVQRETAKKSATSERNNVSSLERAGKIITASDSSSAGKAESYKHHSQSRSPFDSTNSAAQISSKRSDSSKSCRIFIRYGNPSSDFLPTEDNIRDIFSVHGHIIGMFYIKACVIYIKGYVTIVRNVRSLSHRHYCFGFLIKRPILRS